MKQKLQKYKKEIQIN